MSDQETILLQTKLHRPRLPNDLLPRSRLIQRLNEDIDRQLILVCGPAGFGKTTLIGTWLERMASGREEKLAALPSAWLSLDEGDSDLNLFLRYFIAALRTVFEEACEDTLGLLGALQQPPSPLLFSTLINDLERLPGDLVLVLDDFHAIHNAEVHQLLGELVRHWPQPLHLVLISRINPPIPLDRMRVQGMLGEIRTRDLRFQSAETAAYLEQSKSTLLDPSAVSLLEKRFEGWPAGLHLAVLSLRSAGSKEPVLAALASENPNITGYLVGEVLTHQSAPIQTFLLRTSILDRFCASLCEALIDEADPAWAARESLDWIERAELFVTSLDDRREWYRYHHLFQELLRQRLAGEMTIEQIGDLHLRASVWFEKHGLIDEALQHALAAGDIDLAARQMGAGLRDALNREDRPTLERWLRQIPAEIIEQRPELMMVKVWALQFSWRLDLQGQVLDRVEGLLDSEVGESLPASDLQILRGLALLVRAEHAYFANQLTRAIELCRQVLALLPPSWTFARGGGMIYLGLSTQASGQADQAERLLLREYESYGNRRDIYALFLLQSLGFIYLNTGRLDDARRITERLHQEAADSGLTLMKHWANWFLGVVGLERNELETAERHFGQIFENRYTAQISPYRDAVAGLALIHQARGESSEALRMVESISQFDLQERGTEDGRTRSLRARLMLLQGDLEGARRWAESFTDPPPDQALLWVEEPQMTRARILLAGGTEIDLRLARQILDGLVEIAERTHNTRYRIEILALHAMVLETQGESSQAEGELKDAIQLARPGGFRRAFLDLGTPMREMLRRVSDQGHFVEAIRPILTAFHRVEVRPISAEGRAQLGRSDSPEGSSLVEPLTPREVEVLSLLRGPMNVREIALKLNISYATAKRHINNIYGKLGVGQRWKAVAKAEELNLLPPR
jgi:LuxR family maltose regulon positive regulatory protein